MKQVSVGAEIGQQPIRGTFVQTERDTHAEWARLTAKKPSAAAVLHYLVANVGRDNAVFVAQKTIAAAIELSDRTVRTAIHDLEAGSWLQVVRVGAGRECVYVLNDRVSWAESRTKLRLSRFSAMVVADADDQTEETLSQKALRRVPKAMGHATGEA